MKRICDEPSLDTRRSYSDDGATMLALAQSFIDANGAYDQLTSIRYLTEWLSNGRFSTRSYAWDVGMTTRLSLRIWIEAMWEAKKWRSDAASQMSTTQENVDRALKREHSSGNGSLMRITPLGIAMYRDREPALEAARQQSSVTHPAPACAEACALFTDLICRTMNGTLFDYVFQKSLV